VDLVEGLRLDFNRGSVAPYARARDGRGDAAGKSNVVVFNQHGVKKSGPMIRRPSGAHGVLLQRTKGRRRLSRVQHRDTSLRRVHEAPRERGDSRQALQEVEGSAFPSDQRARRADHVRDLLATPAPLTVCSGGRHSNGGIEQAKGFERDLKACEHTIGLDQKHPARLLARADPRLRRDVAGADILIERVPYNTAIHARIERPDQGLPVSYPRTTIWRGSPTESSNACTRSAERRSASISGISSIAPRSARTDTLVMGTRTGCLDSDRCF